MSEDLFVNIVKRFHGGTTVAADLRLSNSQSLVTVLFGPSGAGKTTILRCVAGLEHPESGEIRYGQEVWYDAARSIAISPQQRRIGYLFQEHALFPHLSVRKNIEYGLGGLGRIEKQRRVDRLLDLFHLGGLEDQHPRKLSGGETQRVALARAVATEPRLLLLDEPLSALDAPTRGRLRGELRALLLRVNIPTVLVTHDRTEAIALGDILAVVVEGCVQQVGPVQEVFSRPANQKVAGSVGVETIVPGQIVGSADGLLKIEVRGRQLLAVDGWEFESREVHLCIRAEEVMLERDPSSKVSARNHLSGRIVAVAPEGPLIRVVLDCGFPLTALVTRQSRADLMLEPGEIVTAVIKAPSVHLIPRG
jgi:molybdate transport system ATP-binding protein